MEPTIFKPRLKFKPPLKFFKFGHWSDNFCEDQASFILDVWFQLFLQSMIAPRYIQEKLNSSVDLQKIGIKVPISAIFRSCILHCESLLILQLCKMCALWPRFWPTWRGYSIFTTILWHGFQTDLSNHYLLFIQSLFVIYSIIILTINYYLTGRLREDN